MQTLRPNLHLLNLHVKKLPGSWALVATQEAEIRRIEV
jgi:hypothetical protein